MLIRNAAIISMDPSVGDLQRGDVLIDGSKITAISHSIDHRRLHQIVCVGVDKAGNCTWESLLRATDPDWSLAQYFTGRGS
jgi:5-methylthioadenosine/S-adenosylhomocysteine deaminase